MPTYRIIRKYAKDMIDDDRPAPEVLKTGLTLEEAQAHCNDPETSSRTATSRASQLLTATHGDWFDAYYPEEKG
jgi:hypothetical protein